MRVTLLVVLAFVLLAVALTWPLAFHAASAVEDVHDALLNTWILAWDGHALLTNPLHLFDTNIFYPYQSTLAFSEIILPQALIALPITLASGNPILGYNLALIASFVLSGLAAYLLVLRMTRNRWAGVAAGIVFAFNAYRMSNFAQAQLLALQWLPLVLIYLSRTVGPPHAAAGLGARRRKRDAFLLGLFFGLQALSSFYYAVLTAIAIAVWLAAALIVRRGALSAAGVWRALLALALAGLVVLPFTLPYVRAAQELGFTRSIAESEPFSASLMQYVQALPNNLLYGRLAPAQSAVIGGYPLDSLFAGFLTLALALTGLIAFRRQPRFWLFPLLLLLVAFLLSLGPVLTLAPGQTVALSLPMPYRILYLLPVAQALRAPVRFAALFYTGLSTLVGLGVAALSDHLSQPGEALRADPAASAANAAPPTTQRRVSRGAVIVCALLLAGLLAEVITLPAAQASAVATGAHVPDVYRWLAAQPQGVALELPMMVTTPELGLLNQYYSTYHWQSTPDGYSGFIPPSHGQVVYEMQSFPSERSLSLLQGLGVRYLGVHTNLVDDWPQRQQQLAAYSAQITQEQTFGATVVYGLVGQPAGNHLTPALFLPAAGEAGAPYTSSLIVANEDAGSTFNSATAPASVDVSWRSGGKLVRDEKSNVALPLVTSEASVAFMAFSAPAAGTYSLTVKVQLPNGAETTESANVTLQASAVAQPQVIAVRLLSGKAKSDTYRPGDSMQVHLQWKALGKVDEYDSVFLRLLDANGQALVQADGQPAGGTRPTLLWVPGEEIADDWTLLIPSNAAPGRYTLEAGIYHPDNLAPRLTLSDRDQPVERLLLQQVRVAPALAIVGKAPLPSGATLGTQVTLDSYNIEGCSWFASDCGVEPGQMLIVTLNWQADKDIASDYHVFVHLADSDGRPLAQHDGPPRNGEYPTTVWQRGDTVADTHVFTVPGDLPTGTYQLLTGMYDAATGVRLPTSQIGDSIRLANVTSP